MMRQEIMLEALGVPISHYTHAVRFNNFLLISGLTAHDERGTLVGEGDVALQADMIFRNMRKVLDAVGADFSNILKVTVYMLDVKERTLINPIREKYFGKFRPASTLIGVNELALAGMRVEIEAWVGLESA